MGRLPTRRGGDNGTIDNRITMKRNKSNKRQWLAAVVLMIMAAIIVGNLGGLWLASTF
jgi:hypothetical protein